MTQNDAISTGNYPGKGQINQSFWDRAVFKTAKPAGEKRINLAKSESTPQMRT